MKHSRNDKDNPIVISDGEASGRKKRRNVAYDDDVIVVSDDEVRGGGSGRSAYDVEGIVEMVEVRSKGKKRLVPAMKQVGDT